MLFKQSWIFVSDNTNICWIKTFHLYKGFNRKVTKPGFFIKGSARIVEPPRIEYKGFKYKYSVKGDIVRSWVTRSVFYSLNYDKSHSQFSTNSTVIISKKQNIKSKFINGPLPLNVRVKKLSSLIKRVV